jgi:hypothetical protein
MKNLNLTLATILFCLLTSLSYSQDYQIKDGYFITTLKSGVGEMINVKLSINAETINLIQSNDCFKNWDSTTFNNPKNADYIEKHKSHPHYETFLFSNINMASIYAQMDLKNYQSYLPIEGSEGMIYIIDGKINISFPFKAQNGYGNMIFMKAYYSMKFVNGKTETTHFVN